MEVYNNVGFVSFSEFDHVFQVSQSWHVTVGSIPQFKYLMVLMCWGELTQL